jgi:hypothetical protein
MDQRIKSLEAENKTLRAMMLNNDATYDDYLRVKARLKEAEAELTQYADVLFKRRKLPDPELHQDQAYLAHVLGGQEKLRELRDKYQEKAREQYQEKWGALKRVEVLEFSLKTAVEALELYEEVCCELQDDLEQEKKCIYTPLPRFQKWDKAKAALAKIKDKLEMSVEEALDATLQEIARRLPEELK